MKPLHQIICLICFGVLLTACGQDGQVTPTAVTLPTPTMPPTMPPTNTPAPEPTATHTAVAEPTATATLTAVPTAEATATAQEVELIIHQPQTLAELPVGQEVTISGVVMPPQSGTVEIQVTVAGGQVMTATTATIGETGNWAAMVMIPPNITGPAEVTAQFAAKTVTNQITLVPENAADAITITMNRPKSGATAVAGRMLLFDGRVNNPLGETVTIAVLDNDCTTTAASQSFTVTGGSWIGYTIISATAAPGPACAVAYTGTRGQDVWREARIPLIIAPADDQETVILQLGNNSDLLFKAGETIYLFGIAINAPDNEVSLRLESDDPSRPSSLITSASAFANQYGFWEIDLEIPEDAGGMALFYVTISSNDQNYREIRLPVTIQE